MDEESGLFDVKCDKVFALFIYQVSRHLRESVLKEIVMYVCLLRRALNEKGWELLEQLGQGDCEREGGEGVFCEMNSAKYLLEISNDFITEILPRLLI